MEGPLSKWTNVMKGWQYRWFVLDDAAGIFSYYTSKSKMSRGERRGCVRLRGALIGIDDEDDSTFTITVDNKTFHFQAQDSEERERWIRALEDTVVRHNQLRWTASSGRIVGGVVGVKTGGVAGSPLSAGAAATEPATIENFEKKLAEADSYLQLLLGQVQKLEAKSAAAETTEEARRKYASVLIRANEMVESIKQAIVLLQIAKNAAAPDEPGAVKEFNGALDALTKSGRDEGQS